MTQINFSLDNVNLAEFYGNQNKNLNLLASYYPKLKIVARDKLLTAKGSKAELEQFEKKLAEIIDYLHHYNSLSERNIKEIVTEDNLMENIVKNADTLLYGLNGKAIKARTANQKKIVDAIKENDMVFAIGPAGTGKTYTSVALAVKALKDKEVKRIILTRPAVEAGENLGFLPGDLKEKLDPYLQPLYDALFDMVPFDKLNGYIEKKVIEIAPLAFMRGRTLDDAFVILDEAQNSTNAQMKMFLTRMGKNAKFIITGDPSQIDLPKKQHSGLERALKLVKPIAEISVVELDAKDVVRHEVVKKIIKAYEADENKDI